MKKRRNKGLKRAIGVALVMMIMLGGILWHKWDTMRQQSDRNIENAAIEEAVLIGAGTTFTEMVVTLPDYVEKNIIPVNGVGRRGVPLEEVNGIVIHYVGNPGTTAAQNHSYYSQPETQVSSHFLIGMEGEVILCVPLREKSSASNDRNRDTISIEVCHPEADGVFTQASYDRLVELTAWLCRVYGLETRQVIRHYDITGKACPLHFVEDSESWNVFLADVASKCAEKTD